MGDIELLFQDRHLLLISKPSGLLSLSGRNPLNKDSVHHRLMRTFPTATLAHRLDFGTSGVMVVALDKFVNAQLTKQFQQRSVLKSYKAIVAGHIKEDQGFINLPIAKDNRLFPRVKICANSGKSALTHFHVEERLIRPHRTVVRFTPHTGRTHQLRIHALSIGHPILGCDLYGNANSMRHSDRLMLHATSLTFFHPITGESINAQSTCPF